MATRAITTVSVDSVFVRTWGCSGVDDGMFNVPTDVAVDMNGALYVTDSYNHRIQCFHSSGKFIRKWGTKGMADGEFNWPQGIAIGVVNGTNESILNAMRSVPELYAFPPGVLPICVAYVGDEWIYVVDSGNHRIQVFECDGKFIRKWGSKGSKDGQLDRPYGIAMSGSGIIYASDLYSRIKAFSSNGTFIRKWGIYGDDYETNKYCYSRGISVSSDGLIYVADAGNGNVRCFHSNGTIAHQWTPSTSRFAGPMNVLATANGMVFVSDQLICQFRSNGTFIRKWGSEGSEDGQLNDSRGMAQGMDGVLYIADCGNHRIVAMRVGM